MPDDAPRLFLITPALETAEPFAPLLEAALDAGDVACVLVRTASHDEGTAKAIVRALAPLIQSRGAACLVVGDSRLAARTDADGVQVHGIGTHLGETLAAMQPARIVGVGGLSDRDTAMEAGEAGVDYLIFGEPEGVEPHAAICERVAWWAGIFNVPCVGYVADPTRARDIAEAGAEFIALCEGLWEHPETVAATIARVTHEIRPLAQEAAR